MYTVDRNFKSDNWWGQVVSVHRLGANLVVRAVFWEGLKGTYIRTELSGVLGNYPSVGQDWPVGSDWLEIECNVPFSVNDLHGAPGRGLIVSANMGVGINLVTLSAANKQRPDRHLFKDETFSNFSIGVGVIAGPIFGTWQYLGAAGAQGES